MKTNTFYTLFAFFTVIIFANTCIAQVPNGLSFDGIDDHIQTTTPGITGSGARTIECRIKTTANALPTGQGGTGQKVLVDWGAGTPNGSRSTFNLLFNNAIRFEVAGNGVNGSIPVNDGLWHHVAMVYDPSQTNTVSLYVDGVLDVAGNLTVGVNTTSGPIRIGRRIDDVNYFEGEMDEVRVWNVARTQVEIQANMNSELCNLPSSLILYLPLNQGIASGANPTVTTATNYSSTATTATLNNFALTGATSNWITATTLTPGFQIGGSSSVSNCGNYLWPVTGQTYVSSGTYSGTATSTSGCDSIVSLNLTITQNTSSNQSVSFCGSYTWPVNNQTYTAAGIYTHIIPNAANCDSTITLFLNAGNNTFATQTVSQCYTYTWPQNNQTYTTSGSYAAVIPNTAGCDSIITLNLTINQTTTSFSTISACESYTWSANGTTYSSTGSYNVTLTNAAGCDSIANLDLTILGPTFASQTVTSCGDFVWPINGMTYTATGIYEDTIPNVNGCDSNITLDLTVIPMDKSVSIINLETLSANQSGAIYQWINCADSSLIVGQTGQTYYPTSPGSYAVIITFNNCTDTSACILMMNAGLDNLFLYDLSLFPNPTSGNYTLRSEVPLTGSLKLLDASGRTMTAQTLSSITTLQMSLENYENGVYFLRLSTSEGQGVLRLVKQN